MTLNVTPISTGQALQVLRAQWASQQTMMATKIRLNKEHAGKNLDFDNKSVFRAHTKPEERGMLASIMLWGSPGIGKTNIVEQLAAEIGAMLFDVRLTTIESSDLRGLPAYDHEKKMTVWYRPEDMPSEREKPVIFFLDELSSAPEHMQPTVYGLLQERRVGKHTLGDNVLVVGAGNEITDGAVAYDMGTAIAKAHDRNLLAQQAF